MVFLLFALAIFNGCSRSPVSNGTSSPPPSNQSPPGFIGLWTTYNGTIYGGWGWPSGELLQSAFNFGINGIVNVANLDGYSFQANLSNNCTLWNTNQVFGIIWPPVGHDAAVNQPGDTLTLQPFAQTPGMIQGAHRISELSKVYPQITGIIIDDFGGSYLQNNGITATQLLEIRDALHGQSLDASGGIVPGSPATTPNLKLYVVDYESQPLADLSISGLIDGVVLYVDNDQNTNYVNLDQYVNAVELTYPGKGIMVGVDISTGRNPDGIKNMIQHSVNLYSRGYINGVLLFNGWFLTRQGITEQRWDSLAIPPLLDSLYYPNLGEADGTVIDSITGNPVANALVTVRRVTGTNTQLVTRKFTSNIGEFNFGGWAGNGSSVYEIEVSKSPYVPRTLDAELQPGMRIVLPEVRLTQ